MSEVRVQAGDFDLGAELARLRAGDARVGAVVSFVGTVRDMNDGAQVSLSGHDRARAGRHRRPGRRTLAPV